MKSTYSMKFQMKLKRIEKPIVRHEKVWGFSLLFTQLTTFYFDLSLTPMHEMDIQQESLSVV
jgi:hypothetical protein